MQPRLLRVPDYYYKQKYPNRGSKKLSDQLMSRLRDQGIKVSGADRGLDHGIWVPLKVAFVPEDCPRSFLSRHL
jgi:4,5-DOPA dioxygenase extradiol